MIATARAQSIAPAPGFLAQEWGVVATLWRRDMLRLRRERSRWLGVVLQPLMLWLIIGSGMTGTFTLKGAEGLGYLQYFFPGVLVMIVLFTAIFATISVIEDRQLGFLQGVLVAPGSRASMVLGKVAGVTTLALLQASLFVPLAPLAGYPLGQIAYPTLLMAVVLGCMGLTAIGFSLAWILSSAQAYHAVMSVLLIPLWMLSGAMFPAHGAWIQGIMGVNPMTYAVSAVRHALAPASVNPGPGLALSLGVLLGFATLALALAILVSRRVGARPT